MGHLRRDWAISWFVVARNSNYLSEAVNTGTRLPLIPALVPDCEIESDFISRKATTHYLRPEQDILPSACSP